MFWNVFGELLLFWCSTANITGCLENTNLENADLENADLENTDLLKRRPRKHPGGGGHLGILGVGMCRPGLQIGNPF